MSIIYNDLGNLKVDLARLPEKIRDIAFEVLIEQAHLIQGLAQVNVRVDTGSLRDSIRVERGGEGEHWRRVRIRAGGYITNPRTGKLVDYAVFVETHFPFLGPAVDEVKPTITDMIKNAVVEGVGSS